MNLRMILIPKNSDMVGMALCFLILKCKDTKKTGNTREKERIPSQQMPDSWIEARFLLGFILL